MHKSVFEHESFNRFFEGYTDGSHWKHYAMPWFTKEMVQQIIAEDGAEWHYDEDTDTYIWKLDDENYENWQGKDFIVNGETIHLYPIGGGTWLWEDFIKGLNCHIHTKIVYNYLETTHNYLKPKELYKVYYHIIQETDSYMTEKELKIYTDGFMSAYMMRN